MTTAIIEQGREWARGWTEGLGQGVSALETQIAELELMIARTPAPLRALGKCFHFGPAEELGSGRSALAAKHRADALPGMAMKASEAIPHRGRHHDKVTPDSALSPLSPLSSA